MLSVEYPYLGTIPLLSNLFKYYNMPTSKKPGETSFGEALMQGSASRIAGIPFDILSGAAGLFLGSGFQRKQADYQLELQRKLMNEINEYNSPRNMRALHEAAGLNYQALMSGGGGSSAQAAKSSLPGFSMPNPSDGGIRGADPLTVASALSQIRLNDSAAHKNYQDASLTPQRRKLMESEAVLNSAKSTVEGFNAALKSVQLYVDSETADLSIMEKRNDVYTQFANLNILYEQWRDWQFKNDKRNPAELEALNSTIELTEAKIVTEITCWALNTANANKARVEASTIWPLANALISERYSVTTYNDSKTAEVWAGMPGTEAESNISEVKAEQAQKNNKFDTFMHKVHSLAEAGDTFASIVERCCRAYALISGKDVDIKQTDQTVEEFFDRDNNSSGKKVTTKIHQAKEAYEIGKALSSAAK